MQLYNSKEEKWRSRDNKKYKNMLSNIFLRIIFINLLNLLINISWKIYYSNEILSRIKYIWN